jgi:hypothetical protein
VQRFLFDVAQAAGGGTFEIGFVLRDEKPMEGDSGREEKECLVSFESNRVKLKD